MRFTTNENTPFFDWSGGRRAFHGGRRGHRHEHGGGRGMRERGSVKYDILAALWDGPRHGYDIMLAIEERRGMRPSPGSIYPALALLEDEDYITGRETDGKRVYTIAEKGSELLKKHREENPDQDAGGIPTHVATFVRGITALHGAKDALKQIARSRDADLAERAVKILERTRRDLYSLLAEHI